MRWNPFKKTPTQDTQPEQEAKPRSKKNYYRDFMAAKSNTLFSRWKTVDDEINIDIHNNVDAVRARARDLAKNNDYIKRYQQLLVQNVIGCGIRLQVRSRDADGSLDAVANTAIEQAWNTWTRKGVPTVDGRLSWYDVEQKVMKNVPIDGEMFIRFHRVNNEFKIELIGSEYIDIELNKTLPNDGRIIMGIEQDKFYRTVAYWVLTRPAHPLSEPSTREHMRIPASQMIQIDLSEFTNQYRGFPWIASSMRPLKLLDSYRESELVAAKVGAAQMGFFTSDTGEMFVPDDKEGADDEEGNLVMEVDPGTFRQLPKGMNFSSFTPEHPTTAYNNFVQEILRSIASGLGVSYNSLANDLTSVNFSSLRHGALEDRDRYRTLQKWIIDTLHQRVFERWLEFSLLTGKIQLPADKFDKFNNVIWQPRGWQWVDPQKEASANKEMLRMGAKTLTKITAEQGWDLEDTLLERQRELQLIEQHGLTELLEAGLDVEVEQEPEPVRPEDE